MCELVQPPKLLLACDLDRTFLHPRFYYRPGDVCAELYQGKPHTLISKRAYRLYQSLPPEILFVPVTTRSELQFRRIHPLSAPWPAFGIYAHGSHLVRKGVEDPDWHQNAKKLLRLAEDEFSKAEALLPMLGAERIRRIDGTYIQCHTSRPAWVEQRLRQLIQPVLTEILWGDEKLFLMSRAVNKGSAVRTLRNMVGSEQMFAAGDTEFDVPMLATADLALVPNQELADAVLAAGGTNVRVLQGDFSAGILKTALGAI